jgi:hypothetical protein
MSHFIKQFAQQAPVSQLKHCPLGTMAGTKTIEGQDQDKQKEVLSMGTQTITESVEGSDQDEADSLFWGTGLFDL